MSYPIDLRDKDWDLIKPHFATRKYGNRGIHSRLSLVDGILYGVKTEISVAYVADGFSPMEDALWLFSVPLQAWNLGKSAG